MYKSTNLDWFCVICEEIIFYSSSLGNESHSVQIVGMHLNIYSFPSELVSHDPEAGMRLVCTMENLIVPMVTQSLLPTTSSHISVIFKARNCYLLHI